MTIREPVWVLCKYVLAGYSCVLVGLLTRVVVVLTLLAALGPLFFLLGCLVQSQYEGFCLVFIVTYHAMYS